MAAPRPRRGGAAARGWAAAALLACGLAGRAAAQRQGGGPEEPPKWLSDDGKDIFTSLEQETENWYGDEPCELREKLLKHMAGRGEADAAMQRTRVLLGLGLCEFRKGNYVPSKKRLMSAIADMETNFGSEDNMLKHPGIAMIPLMKQAADFMTRHEVTQAGTALRRCREVLERNLKKVLKQLHQQQSVPLQLWYDEISGYGKTGNYLPQIKKQFPMFKQDLGWLELLDNSLDALDARMATMDKGQKTKRSLLQVSKGKAAGGTLLYVRALHAEPIIDAERLTAAQELSTNVAKAFKEEAASLEKAATLVKRSKEGSGCQDGKGLAKTCTALKKVADIQSNGFGEARVLVAKAGKKQSIEVCSTNANLGILMAAKDGARLSVSGGDKPVELKAGEPLGFDFCRESTLEADSTTPVLFAQVWHPEFAAVERTTELRARSEAFGLSEGEVKEAAKVVNDNAKWNWEKTAKKWRQGSPFIEEIKSTLQSEQEEKARKEEEAAEAKRKEEEAGDEVRKRNLEELQRKREAKQKAEQEKEEARKRRQKMLEEERAKRDPWLNAPSVKEVEAKIDSLKEQRRDANAKLEFDLSTQLTKDISTAERQLKKVIKKAKKEYKKTGKVPTEASDTKEADAKEQEEEEAALGGGELAKLKDKLKQVKEQKAKASKNENFKEAKRLKQQQQELEAQIAKLEL